MINRKPIELQIKFGKRLKELRMKAGMSQEALGFESKLDRTYISGIERGVRNPSLINIGKIARALHVKVEEIFSPEN